MKITYTYLVVIMAVCLMSCNERSGVYREFYEGGKLKAEIEMKGGKLHGLSRMYDENGTLLKEEHWINGLQHGEAKILLSDGRVKERHRFVDGRKSGKSELFYSDGTIKEERFYDSLGKLLDVRSYSRAGDRDYDNVLPISHFSSDTVPLGSNIEYFARLVNANPSLYTEGTLIISSKLTEEGDPVDTLYSVVSNNEKGFRYSLVVKTPGVNALCGALIFEIPVDTGRVYSRFSFRTGYYVTLR